MLTPSGQRVERHVIVPLFNTSRTSKWTNVQSRLSDGLFGLHVCLLDLSVPHKIVGATGNQQFEVSTFKHTETHVEGAQR